MYCETTMLFSVGNINCAKNPTPVEKKINIQFFYKAAFFKFVLANLHDISKNHLMYIPENSDWYIFSDNV